jgi:DNA (cytosine-5)-methyltransferase 1
MTFTVLDLFSGIGGFSLGLERTGGFKTVAFCEIDPFCRKVLAKHWPSVPCYDDIRELTAVRLRADGIVPDVLCGGFPCQDISIAGAREGIEASRSGLWREMARLVGEIRPRFLIVENVAALLDCGMGRVLGDLAAVGYDAEWHCVPASAIGAPHIRDRVWIIAHPGRGVGAQSILTADNVAEGARRNASQWRQNRVFAQVASIRPEILQARVDRSKNARMDDGLSDWPHRARALGNAVVPQIPEMIGRAILAAERAGEA